MEILQSCIKPLIQFTQITLWMQTHYIDGLAQDCGIFIVFTMEITQSCTLPSTRFTESHLNGTHTHPCLYNNVNWPSTWHTYPWQLRNAQHNPPTDCRLYTCRLYTVDYIQVNINRWQYTGFYTLCRIPGLTVEKRYADFYQQYEICVTHCGLVMQYNGINLYQHWFRQWLAAW